MAFQPAAPKPPPDTTVDAYERVVNGKVVKVNAYGKKPSTSTKAVATARKRPGRPRMAGNPGTYASGRDIPGVKAQPPAPKPQPLPQEGPNASRPPEFR